MPTIQFTSLHGISAAPFGPDLARLRIQIFREFPYLYDGSIAYEERYLQTYFDCPDSLIVLARLDQKLVGAATAIPLRFEESAFQKPFLDQNIPPEQVMYFGESVLLPEYRGRGIGKTFLQMRLDYAQAYSGIQWAAFCAVLRDIDDARRPPSYHSLDALWQSFGFAAKNDMQTHYHWQEIGQSEETEQPMQFWLRALK